MRRLVIVVIFIFLCCVIAQAQTCTNGQSPIWSATTGWTCGSVTPGPLPSGSSLSMTIANAGVTGTTANRLAKLTGAPSTAVITATSDTEGAIGVCVSGCGTAGSATIAIIGQVSCAFDGATTAGNYVTISATTAGMCHDAGSAFPTAQAAYGRVLSTNGGAGTYVMELMTPDIAFQNGGNGKSRPAGSTESIQFRNSSGNFDGTSFVVTNGTHIALSQNQGSLIGFSNTGATGIAFGGFRASGQGAVKVIADSSSNPGTILSTFNTPPAPGGNPTPWSSQGMNYTQTLTSNATIGNPGNHGGDGTAPSGYRFAFKLVQDGTGGRVPSWSSDFRFLNGITPTTSRTASAVDVHEFIVDGDIAYEVARYTQDSPNTSVASDLTNATTTFSNITGLSANIRNTSVYSFRFVAYVSDDIAADGAKFDFDGGTATFSNARIHCTAFDTALVLSTQTTAIATDVAIATLTGNSLIECYGTLTASGNGTFIPRFAQNAHTTGTLTLFQGSHLLVTAMP